MKAAILYGVRNLRIENVPIPQLDRGEVLVRIRAATTCGTDLKIFQRSYVSHVIKLPTIFGHEWAGEIVDLASDVDWLEKGMRIRAGNSAPCLRCKMCERGKFNLCENMIWLWGAYAEYLKVPAQMVRVNLQKIPAHVSYEEAALTEPLACVLHGVEEARVKLGDTIAIIGAGPIGLLHLLTVRRLGVERVFMVDLVEERLEFARRIGADETINGKREDVIRRIKELTDGYGADVVIEAVGLPSTWEQALRMVRKGGTVLEFGGCPPGTQIKVSTELLHYGEVKVLGAFHTTPIHFRRALQLISSRTINVKSLITRRMPLDQLKDAFELLATSKREIKIAITP